MRDAAIASVRALVTGDEAQAETAREEAAQALVESQGVTIEEARTQVEGYEAQYRETVGNVQEQATEVAEMLKPYEGQPKVGKMASIHDAIRLAEGAEPGMKVAFVAFPGTPFSSPHHFGIFMRGDEAFSSRLYKPVLIDAATGAITDRRNLPWYLTALLLSQPLHFGDYGGQAMKLLWALLDIATMIVLGSGLYLWFKRGRAANKTATQARPAVRDGLAQDARALARTSARASAHSAASSPEAT